MIIRHHLAKGFNDIPLKNLRYATEHKERRGEIEHVGWKIVGDYSGDKVKSMKHKYEVIFSPDEAQEFMEKLAEMLKRFNDESVRDIVESAGIEEVDDAD